MVILVCACAAAGNMIAAASTASDDLKFCIFAPPWIFVVRAQMARESGDFAPLCVQKQRSLAP
jgi:hypothetical protein